MMKTATMYTCDIPLLSNKALHRAKTTGMFPRNIITTNAHWIYEYDFDQDEEDSEGEWEIISDSDISE